MSIHEDQYREIIDNAVKEHLSLDKDFVDDWGYEITNLADKIAKELRLYGYNLPRILPE